MQISTNIIFSFVSRRHSWITSAVLFIFLSISQGFAQSTCSAAFQPVRNPAFNSTAGVISNWTFTPPTGGWVKNIGYLGNTDGASHDDNANTTHTVSQTVYGIAPGSEIAFDFAWGNGNSGATSSYNGGFNGNGAKFTISYAGVIYLTIDTSPYRTASPDNLLMQTTVTTSNGASVSFTNPAGTTTSVGVNSNSTNTTQIPNTINVQSGDLNSASISIYKEKATSFILTLPSTNASQGALTISSARNESVVAANGATDDFVFKNLAIKTTSLCLTKTVANEGTGTFNFTTSNLDTNIDTTAQNTTLAITNTNTSPVSQDSSAIYTGTEPSMIMSRSTNIVITESLTSGFKMQGATCSVVSGGTTAVTNLNTVTSAGTLTITPPAGGFPKGSQLVCNVTNVPEYTPPTVPYAAGTCTVDNTNGSGVSNQLARSFFSQSAFSLNNPTTVTVAGKTMYIVSNNIDNISIAQDSAENFITISHFGNWSQNTKKNQPLFLTWNNTGGYWQGVADDGVALYVYPYAATYAGNPISWGRTTITDSTSTLPNQNFLYTANPSLTWTFSDGGQSPVANYTQTVTQSFTGGVTLPMLKLGALSSATTTNDVVMQLAFYYADGRNPFAADPDSGAGDIDWFNNINWWKGTSHYDYDDVPAGYGSAQHGADSCNPSLFIGAQRADTEDVATPNAAANGDNNQYVNDEVLTIPSLDRTATTYTINVPYVNNTSSAATLAGWVDFNGNTTFDAAERASIAIPSGTGTIALTWSGINVTTTSDTYARLRIASDATTLSLPTGTSVNGETEGHLVPLMLTDVSLVKTGPSLAQPSKQITYTLTITNANITSALATTLTDTLPTGTIFVSASDSGTYASGVVTWNLGTLATGASKVVTVVVTTPNLAAVKAGNKTLVNTATVASSNDSNAVNNTSSLTTQVFGVELIKQV